MVKINRIEEPLKTKEIREEYLPKLVAAIQENDLKAQKAALKKYNQTETKDALVEMQANKCAYCELPDVINSQDGDIEHFQPKVHYPKLAFNWDNFFLGCKKCNQRYKRDFDVGAGYPFKILHPEIDDPNDFFEFVVVSDTNSLLGSFDFIIKPKEGISEDKRKIAEQTIALFKLNHITRKKARYNTLKSDIVIVQMAKKIGAENLPPASKAAYQAIQQPTQGYSAWLR